MAAFLCKRIADNADGCMIAEACTEAYDKRTPRSRKALLWLS